MGPVADPPSEGLASKADQSFWSRNRRVPDRIVAPAELARDDELRAAAARKGDELIQNEIVNGEVGNFIFSTLREKTTFIDVSLSADGGHIVTSLTDRGELVFRIREPSAFEELKNSGFTCQLFYLNQSAKTTFARRMGIPSVRFGSVFLFRNGFRVYPIGEDGDDWFGIDARKQQGYAKFLGTRDVIGRIEVSGTEEEFKEASSRNRGTHRHAGREGVARVLLGILF